MSALSKPQELLIGMIHAPTAWEHWPAAKAMLHLIEALKNLKDVETVYTNVEISDEVLARS